MTPKEAPRRLRHPLYRVWVQMRQRCTNPKCPSYPDYGGRGIGFDPRWNDFATFLADMGERPPGTSLDRKDNDAGYFPDNCRWATHQEQQQNRRDNRLLTYGGRTQCIAEWAREIGGSRMVIHHRLRRGWTLERVLSTPARAMKSPIQKNKKP